MAFLTPVVLYQASNGVSGGGRLRVNGRSSRRRILGARPRYARMCENGPGEATGEAGSEETKSLTGENNNTTTAKKDKGEKKVGGTKSLLKPDGTPYAPWMRVAAGSEDSTSVRRKTEKELTSVGLKTKYLGDELELSWRTGGEAGNLGFVISRKSAREGSEFKVLDDSTSARADLSSKGPDGGSYSYLVRTNIAQTPGSWVYKLSDIDAEGNITDLAQTLVEVEAAEDTKLRSIALAALLAVLAIAVFFGLSLDPM